MNIQELTKQTLNKIGIPVSVFCQKMNISQTAYYRWIHDDLKLSAEKENKIKKYVIKLNEVVLNEK